ncbi:MAG: hypothetical protein ACREU7_12420, partial [Burkholderiales bacterium]
MTDPELLALLAEKTPDELTEQQIELLRRRLTESAELREALFSQVQMEAYLATALGRINFSTQDILRRAQQHEQSQTRSLGVYLGVPLALVALGITLFLFRDALWGRRVPQDESAQAKRIVDFSKDKRGRIKPKENELPATERPADADPNAVTKASDSATAAKSETPAASAEPPAPATPWQQVLALENPPAFADEAFRTFDVQRQLPRRTDLLPWFEAAAGHNYRITEVDTPKGKCAQLEGLARLRAPWMADSALKLSLENYNRLQLHFYRGTEGVTFVYYEDQQYRWA